MGQTEVPTDRESTAVELGPSPLSGPAVLYLIGTFPLLTTTFVDRELAALRSRGTKVGIVSIRRPAGPLSPEQETMMGQVLYVMPVSPWRLMVALATALTRRGPALLAVSRRLVTGRHPSLRSRLKTLGHIALGVYVWGLVRKRPPGHVHAHFVDRAATLAKVVSALVGVEYSVTAHANDIYVDPVLLREKATGAKFVATCTEFNERHLTDLAPEANIELVYHGLDFDRFQETNHPDPTDARLVSIAQLKEKKGLTDLISACKILAERGVHLECEIIGDGPLRSQLENQIRADGLSERVRLLGSMPHEKVIQHLAASSLFVLPSVIAADGDRDGIPNVILEAMALGRPVVATSISGIPEAVIDGVTGTLVPPGRPEDLAGAIAKLLQDPETRSRMGIAGRGRVEDKFDAGKNVLKLEELLLS